MKIAKKFLLSAFACAFALEASAQASDGYVYETDDLNYESLSIKSNNISGAYVGKYASYVSKLLWTKGVLNFDKAEGYGLFVTASNAILKQIEFKWASGYPISNPTMVLYCSDAPYTKISELSASNSIGQSDILYPTVTLVPDDDYRYWGIACSKNSAFFSNIIVTWQLAHFRENLTVDNLCTICLPYDVKADDLVDELTAYTIVGKIMDNSDKSKVEALVFEEVEEMKAGVAYLFMPKKSGICLKYFGTEVQAPVDSENGLNGSFVNHTFSEEECANGNIFLISNNSIRLAGAGAGVGANRAYINTEGVQEYNGTNSSRKLLVSANGYIETGDSPTVVEMLKAIDSLKEGKNQTSAAYDLQGRMVSSTPAQGIVMENGKKKLVGIK